MPALLTICSTETGKNIYDVRKDCDRSKDGQLCYKELQWIETWMNLPEVKKALGVNPSLDFESCNMQVNQAFAFQGDGARNRAKLLPELVESGIRVLIYAGTLDWICNWVSNSIWPEELEWVGKQRYNEARWRSWTVNGKEAGRTKSAGPLTFASIYGAGHLISIHFVVTGPFGADSTSSCVIRSYGQA